jgi:hypothetical protein
LGVRESILLVALDGSIPQGVILLSALVFRLVTVLGDIFYYILIKIARKIHLKYCTEN